MSLVVSELRGEGPGCDCLGGECPAFALCYLSSFLYVRSSHKLKILDRCLMTLPARNQAWKVCSSYVKPKLIAEELSLNPLCSAHKLKILDRGSTSLRARNLARDVCSGTA